MVEDAHGDMQFQYWLHYIALLWRFCGEGSSKASLRVLFEPA
ncbi:hypothetical protein EV13_2414 [Prochlorococcus sp. MIT 0702]|nr:hypothetical protein EV13_2414 [Prochlorococcus sp. MIT 0702]KGG29388.1 hypothetical protein EV12_0170 [Prochlorococcus sp. MIT 0701]KGG33689.1 hypothetical protein EV14_1578 [Prochlorococcus sp. MIT 0703]